MRLRSTNTLALIAFAAGLSGCGGRSPRSPADAARACSAKAPAPCEAACFHGDGAACAIFGEAVGGVADAPVRLPQDLPRGRKALAEGCRLGNLDACRTKATYEEDEAPAEACAELERLCGRGDLRSCTFFAGCLAYEDEFRRDKPRAWKLYESGCARGDSVACRELGFLYMNADGVARDYRKAFELMKRACDMDEPLACAHEGRLLERGQGAPRDLDRAKALYRGACARGIRPIPCEGLRHLGEEPPSTVAKSADAAESLYVSPEFDFEWRLPANWELVPPTSIQLSEAFPGAEVVAARRRGTGSPESVVALVSHFSTLGPSGARDDDPAIVRMLEQEGTVWFAERDLAQPRSSPLHHPGKGINLDGVVPRSTTPYLTMSLFKRDARRFELRCLHTREHSSAPCAEALGAFMVHEKVKEPSEYPRVLHLDEPRFGLSFDAPDDGWLAFGPIVHLDPRGTHWYWVDGLKHQIELSVYELSASHDSLADDPTAAFTEMYRSEGSTVAVEPSQLGGRAASHIGVDQSAGRVDVFIQRRGALVCVLRVSAPTKDASLVAQAVAGLKLTASAP